MRYSDLELHPQIYPKKCLLYLSGTIPTIKYNWKTTVHFVEMWNKVNQETEEINMELALNPPKNSS